MPSKLTLGMLQLEIGRNLAEFSQKLLFGKALMLDAIVGSARLKRPKPA